MYLSNESSPVAIDLLRTQQTTAIAIILTILEYMSMDHYSCFTLLMWLLTCDYYVFSFCCIFYHRPNTQIETLSTNLAKLCASIDKDETVDLALMSSIETLFRSLACINGSFLLSNDAHMCCNLKNHGLNIADAEIAFEFIRKMENLSLKNIVSGFRTVVNYSSVVYNHRWTFHGQFQI